MESKTIELPDGKNVIIWKMNYGFKTDLQGYVSKTDGEAISLDMGKMQIYTAVFGIYSSDDLGIQPPKDLEMGLSTEEINNRLKKIRGLVAGGDLLYKEINKLNKEVSDEILKK